MVLVFMGSIGGGDVDRGFASGEKGFHDQGSDSGNKRAHDGPFGGLGLALLDIPGGRDDHRESTEVGDPSQDAHALADGVV